MFAKGRAYIGKKKCQNAPHVPVESLALVSNNRVVASLPPMPRAPLNVDSQLPQDLYNNAKENLLKSYQLELERKESLIRQQRDTISKLQSSAASCQELLRLQSQKVAALTNDGKTKQVFHN